MRALFRQSGAAYHARSFNRELRVSSIIFGLVFIVGGLSGTLALVGTNSGTALAVVGVLLVGRGIWRIRKQRARQVQAL
jgi:hypothetical protein